MIGRFTVTLILAILSLAVVKSTQQPDALDRAAQALGANRVKTLKFTASGVNYTVGQNFKTNDPWPPVTIKSYRALINYQSGSMRVDLLRDMGTTMPRGGGVPFTGEIPQIQVIGGSYAWNVLVSVNPQLGAGPATPCTIPEAGGTAWAGPGGSPGPPPAPESQVECMLTLWALPQGFIKAAIANHATTQNIGGKTEVSFTLAGKYKMSGVINAQSQVTNVRTWIEQSIVGDMLIEMGYSDYKDFGGIQFPQHIVQKQDGFPALDLTVSSVTANTPFEASVPDNVRNASAAAAANNG